MSPQKIRKAHRERQTAWAAALVLLVLATALSYWETQGAGPAPRLLTLTRRPEGVMGTTCLLIARVPLGEQEKGVKALDAAEEALRRVEAAMSVHLEDSEISRLNRAPGGTKVPLSPWTLRVLRLARSIWKCTGGAFDVTCRPLLRLWKKAAREGRLPSEEEIARARKASHWDLLEILPGGVRKKSPSLELDLGGIAKGFAIDRALEAMMAAGARAGLVDVGGDLRAFGDGTGPGGSWFVEVRDPFRPGVLGRIALEKAGAVCTSGGYFRYVEIKGRRFSHIVDPRTGRPAEAAASATVLGPEAAATDAWATALAVLGRDGLELLGNHKEMSAVLVTGDRKSPETILTPGMESFFRK